MVRDQLVINDKIKARIEKYEHMIWPLFFQPRGHPPRSENIELLTFLKILHTFLDKAIDVVFTKIF